MRDFYHGQIEELRLTNDLPYVMGLTASPVTRVNKDALRYCYFAVDPVTVVLACFVKTLLGSLRPILMQSAKRLGPIVKI